MINLQQYESFRSILPTLGKRHSEIVEAINILGGRASVSQIATLLDRQVHQVSGRLTELCQKRIISDSGFTYENPVTWRRQTLWELNYEVDKNS